MPGPVVAARVIPSPIGALLMEATRTGLVGASFADGPAPAQRGPVSAQGRIVGDGADPDVPWAAENLERAVVEFGEYFSGHRRSFDVPLDWSRSSGFRREVLVELARGVGYGDVITYGELASRLGRPRAARAVGTAMATNPLVVVVPCHRVMRAGHAIGAYGGGVEAKEWLLRMEGVLPALS